MTSRFEEVVAARGLALGRPLVVAEETVSTNDDAKAGAKAGSPHGAVWLAESQTGGRGRQGRAWLSPRGENLLFSVLLRLRCAPQRVPPVSLVVGLAVRDAVARALGGERDADVVVKWPNDVMVRGRDGGGAMKKVAGVLVESALAGSKVEYVVVGIGVNVRMREMPEDVAAIATSIALERGDVDVGAIDRAEVLADVLAGLERDVELVAHKGLAHVHARLTKHDALKGRGVESVGGEGEALRGIASGIDVDGRLVVRRDDGVLVHVASGEMRLRVV